MSTHNICFYGELEKILLQLSLNTHFTCFTVKKADVYVQIICSTNLLLNMTDRQH